MRRAAVERASTGRPAVRYVIVLTKIDKASKKELAATRKDVDRAFRELLVTFPQPVTDPGASSNEVSISSANEVTIVETSATTRTGRDHMWKLILKLLTERQ